MPRNDEQSALAVEPFEGRLRREQGAVQLLVRFTAPGEPVSKSRARFNGQGPKVRAYTPTSSTEAEQIVKWHYRKAFGPGSPDDRSGFGLACTFYLGKRQRRDVDNMIKLVADALTGLAWADDSQMTEVSGRMIHGSAEPRTVIEVYYTDDLPDHLRRKCDVCGKYFRTYRSWEYKKTCSQKCGRSLVKARRRHTCKHCSAEFFGNPNNDPKFCSKECKYAYGRVAFTCAHCGKPGEKMRSAVRSGRSFCNNFCHEAFWRVQRRRAALGTCMVCGGVTTKKTYRRCNACKIAMMTGRTGPLKVGQ